MVGEVEMGAVRWVDGIVQQGVDAFAFAIMRALGVRKSFVRYAIGLGLAGCTVLRCANGGRWYLLLVVVWIAIAEIVRRVDEAAESRGMASIADDRAEIMKALWLGFLIGDVWRGNFVGICEDILLLMFEYICDTPNEPPPSKKTVLQPAPEVV